uniref:OTU domain-containing protein n=1 Tax=Panagrellus redivivus TaxID=6233 RepID=A0A7E4UR35_PANRE
MSLRKAIKIVVADVPADGHCGYSSVSLLLTGTHYRPLSSFRSHHYLTMERNEVSKGIRCFHAAASTDEARMIDVNNKKINPPNHLNPEAMETPDSMTLSLMLNVNVVVYVITLGLCGTKLRYEELRHKR